MAGEGEKVLKLADQELESAAVVESFLELIVNAKLVIPSREDGSSLTEVGKCQAYLRFLRFLQKYECASTLRLFHLCACEQLITNEMQTGTAFVLGSASDDFELCSTAMKLMCTESAESRIADRFAYGRSCDADPGSMDEQLWDLLPPRVIRAWVSAWAQGCGIHEHECDRDHDLNSVVTHFKMNLAKEEGVSE